MDSEHPIEISLISPLFNEEGSVEELYSRCRSALESTGRSYEMIFVDDGSTDETRRRLEPLTRADPASRLLSFRRNFGQTAALMAGFDQSQGEVIIPIDGDLQNDPEDIPLLLEKLDEGYDLVSGWRVSRQDAPIRRTFVSRVANALVSRISGVRLHDYGCTLKAYRRSIVRDVRLYGEMHRFIPIYASWHGARVTEMPVRHHPRKAGVSKYGLSRIVKVLLDLMVIKFLESYSTRPIHIFGGFGVFCFVIALLSGFAAIFLRLSLGVSLIQTPLPLLVVFMSIIGMMSILMGLLAELQIRTYYEARGQPPYYIRDVAPEQVEALPQPDKPREDRGAA